MRSLERICLRLFNLNHSVLETRQAKMSTEVSIHSKSIAEVYDIPMSVIIRPLVPVLDETKVESLMRTLEESPTSEKVPPIDALWVIGKEGGNYYFSFGGCHRFEAHKRLGRPTIKCKLVQSNVADIRTYLGSSMPDLK